MENYIFYWGCMGLGVLIFFFLKSNTTETSLSIILPATIGIFLLWPAVVIVYFWGAIQDWWDEFNN